MSSSLKTDNLICSFQTPGWFNRPEAAVWALHFPIASLIFPWCYQITEFINGRHNLILFVRKYPSSLHISFSFVLIFAFRMHFFKSISPVATRIIFISRWRAMRLKTSTSSPNRRDASVLGTFLRCLRLWYYQYEVTFSPYVMTTGQKLVLNSIVILFFSLLVMGVYTYLPNLVMRVSMRLLSL